MDSQKKDIIIRPARESDALNLLLLKKGYIKGTTSIPLFADEYKNTAEDEAALIERYINEDNSILLVAEHDGQLIGNLDLTGNQRKKLYHTGMIGMGIANEWQNKGVGRLLMKKALQWAEEASPLTIIWLEVYSTNGGGIRLYEKHGFESCGLIKNFFMDADKITMVKYLNL